MWIAVALSFPVVVLVVMLVLARLEPRSGRTPPVPVRRRWGRPARRT